MYNAEGEKVWERQLDLNGKVISGDNDQCPFTFQGQYYDKEINLSYNRFRYYDAEDGRYISQDPIGLASGEDNFYAYVHDPNDEIDVFGLSSYSGKKPHGNDNNSTNPNHVYVIVDTWTGKMEKVGISGGALNKNGTSGRANRQVNAWNKNQPGRYEAHIVATNKQRMDAKALEQKITDKHGARNHGNQPSQRHKRPRSRVNSRQEYEDLYGEPHNR